MSAYRTVEGGKYYSAETQSSGQYLPEYTPLNMTLSVNSMPLTADENGVYHAYAGGEQSSMLAVRIPATKFRKIVSKNMPFQTSPAR